jgi:hypothetical protein
MIVKTLDHKGDETSVCYNHPRNYSRAAFRDGTVAIKAVAIIDNCMYNVWLPVFTDWWST